MSTVNFRFVGLQLHPDLLVRPVLVVMDVTNIIAKVAQVDFKRKFNR